MTNGFAIVRSAVTVNDCRITVRLPDDSPACPAYLDAVEVDFNGPPSHLLGRDLSREIKVGQTVIAYTEDDQQPYGCIAWVVEVKVLPDKPYHLLVLRSI